MEFLFLDINILKMEKVIIKVLFLSGFFVFGHQYIENGDKSYRYGEVERG